MPLFFFDVHENGAVTSDMDGRGCVDRADAQAWAIQIARGLMSADIATGARSLSCQIKVRDSEDRSICSVACSFAIEAQDD